MQLTELIIKGLIPFAYLSVLGYKYLLRRLASYSPWANVAPGVFLLQGQARVFIPGC
jgi:hypothetical protein